MFKQPIEHPFEGICTISQFKMFLTEGCKNFTGVGLKGYNITTILNYNIVYV